MAAKGVIARFIERIERSDKARTASVDLRHLQMVQISDSWDGETTCSDGTTYRILLYGPRVVWHQEVFKACGATEGRKDHGSEFYRRMYYVAQAFRRIIQIAHTKYWRQEEPKEKDWDTVLVDDVWDALSEHPQYLEHATLMGISLAPAAHGRKRVQVSKTAENAQ